MLYMYIYTERCICTHNIKKRNLVTVLWRLLYTYTYRYFERTKKGNMYMFSKLISHQEHSATLAVDYISIKSSVSLIICLLVYLWNLPG